MTDITELGQREKFEAWARSQKLSLAYGDCGYVYSSTEMAWRAVKALSAELVEALEKTESAKRTLESLGYRDNGGELWRPPIGPKPNFSLMDSYLQRIAELESFRTAYMEWSDKTDWVNTDRRFGVVKPLGKHRADVLKAYIEHLESRTVTVKLPTTRLWAGVTDCYEKSDVIAAIRAAGVEVSDD